MPTATTVRRITPPKQRNFGRIHDEFPVPDLTEIQTRSPTSGSSSSTSRPRSATDSGLEGRAAARSSRSRATTRRSSWSTSSYELGKPRYDPDECRQLRLTYGRPFRVWLRLNKGETAIEEEVYLGDMPIMIGGGEFIINGAERVVVSQLHRSPGVDFVVEIEAGDRKLHACRIIPERGSWIELNVTKKDTLGVRIDQTGKFSAMTLLRAMDPKYSTDADILRAFYETDDREDRRRPQRRARSKARSPSTTSSIRPTTTGEVIVESGQKITKNARRDRSARPA